MSCYISAVGKLWSSAGLRELLVDSGAYAGCTVDQILIGKQFNRGIRAYTLVYEALMTLWLSAFFKWFSEEGHMVSIEENVWQSMLLLHEQFCDPNRNTADISRFHDLFLEHLSPLVFMFKGYFFTGISNLQILGYVFTCRRGNAYKYSRRARR